MVEKPEHPLVVCMKLCEALGDPGRIVWELGKLYVGRKKNPYSETARLEYLTRALKHLKSKAEEQAKMKDKFEDPYWQRLPVDFQTFCDSPELMDKMGSIWPLVMKELVELNSGKYVECVLTGGIGCAKSTMALYTTAYQTYLLSCMSNPHEVFDLDTSSEILMVFQSVNKDVAKEVDYARLRDMINNAPYFSKYFPFDISRESDLRFPRRIIIKPVSGQDTAAIGQNVIGGILDEINFMMVVEGSKQTKDGGLYDQAMENYNSIASRRMSRFMTLGAIPGMLCLVSSRNYPGQFTDIKEEEAKTNKRIFVYDKRNWEINPSKYCFHTGVRSEAVVEQYGADCPLMFRVFVGDTTRKPRVLEFDEKVAEKDNHLVLNVPIEFYQRFKNDILKALRNEGGMATQALNPFMMNTEAISAAFGLTSSILSRTECDFEETRVMIYPKRIILREHPRFCHIDPSKSKDSTGVAMGYVPKFVPIDRGDVIEMLPLIVFDFCLEVKPPKGGEIVYDRIRRLLYACRQQGAPLKWITSDTYQSTDNLQILKTQGFFVGNSSVDDDNLPYETFKQAVYDGRVFAPAHPKAQREMVRLEINQKTGKIDHPATGSKDVSDAMAGVVHGLTQRREIWVKHGVSLRNLPRDLAKQQGLKPQRPENYIQLLRQLKGEAHRKDRVIEEALYGKLPFLVGQQPKSLRERFR